MNTSCVTRTVLLAGVLMMMAAPAMAGLRVGGGIHYLRTVGDIKDNPAFDENAIGFLGSAAFAGSLFRFEGNVEFVPDYAGSGELMWAPQGYALIGQFLYGGVGVGVNHITGFGWQDPFYSLRAGVDFMAGSLDLDVFATYRFQRSEDLDQIGKDDLNTITLSALVRFAI